MSYIGNSPLYAAFPSDTFSGNNSTTAFTMSVAPANTASIIVAVSGVLQDPSTYSVVGSTLNFSAAPPTGTNNINVRYLGIPASGVTTTAFYSRNAYTATANQTSFTVPSYTVGFIEVFRNGVLLDTTDYTASTGTTIVLVNPATAGDTVTVISYYVSSVLNAIPNTAGAVSDSLIAGMSASKLSGQVPAANAPTGSVIQVIQTSTVSQTATTSQSFVATNLTGSITPKLSTSKILVRCSLPLQWASGGAGIALYRNGSLIFSPSARDGTNQFYYGYGSAGLYITMPLDYLDSPSSTSSTSYQIYLASYNGSSSVSMPFPGGQVVSTATMTLMEIAA